jgi:16S rRNA (cytosine967-C5)-methyltransferase
MDLDTGFLDARDAALAHAIVDSAIRRWLTIAALLDACVNRGFKNCEPPVQAALVCGAAQLLFLDRIPDHAAVDHAVEWTLRRVGKRAGGLVNASLRRLIRLRGERRESWTDGRDEIPLPEGGALGLAEEVLPDGVIGRLTASTSHHRSFISRWSRQFDHDRLLAIASHSIRKAPTIINAAHAGSPAPAEHLEPHDQPSHYVFTGDRSELISLLESRRDLWVQDPASSAVVAFCRRVSPTVIVDYCAGKGTKTRGLSAAFPGARIVATDVDSDQRASLRRATAHLANVEVREPNDLAEVHGQADLVLLDVPCSNSGVLARRLEARYRGAGAALERLGAVQREIIAAALPLTRRGAGMVYATCSLESAENRELCDAACRQHGLRIEEDQTFHPAGGPGLADAGWTDASYACLLTTAPNPA